MDIDAWSGREKARHPICLIGLHVTESAPNGHRIFKFDRRLRMRHFS